jgi:hypothetical protein
MSGQLKLMTSSKRIRRIVDELVRACEQNLADELGMDVLVNCYGEGEGAPTYTEDTLTGHLIEYLEVNHVARVLQVYTPTKFSSLPENEFVFATELRCKVLDQRKLVSLADKFKVAQDVSWSARIDHVTGELRLGTHTIRFRPNSNMCGLLRLLLDDREARRDGILAKYVGTQLDKSERAVRDTANNVNRRIKETTGGVISDFLVITTEDIRLSARFV